MRSHGSRSQALAAIAALDLAHPWEVLIRRPQRTRTLRQNRRYWALLQAAAEHSGYTVGELHELCKQNILGSDYRALGETCVEIRRSTRTLSTADFAHYTRIAEDWLVRELDLQLPPEPELVTPRARHRPRLAA